MPETEVQPVNLSLQEAGDVPEDFLPKIWDLYSNAFQATEEQTPRPQPLDFKTFTVIMHDPDFQKYFIGEAGKDPKGMVILTERMDKVEFWINKEYLQHHYPQEQTDNNIIYVVGILTDPEVRGKSRVYFKKILELLAKRLMEPNKILLQDFSPESAPNYPEVVQRYYQNKLGDNEIKYNALDRQLHGAFEPKKELTPKEGSNVKVYDVVPPELDLGIAYDFYASFYKSINTEAVQPQSMSREAFLDAMHDADYIKMVAFDGSGNMDGILIASKKLSKPSNLVNEKFVNAKHPGDNYNLLVGLAAHTTEIMRRLIEQLSAESQKAGKKIYYVGSERSMSSVFDTLGEVTESQYEHHGSQDYGFFYLERVG